MFCFFNYYKSLKKQFPHPACVEVNAKFRFTLGFFLIIELKFSVCSLFSLCFKLKFLVVA